MTFAVICILAAISCRLIELFWMAIYACFAPLMCPNRIREPWPVELCNLLILLIVFIDNTLFKWCGKWCIVINRKLIRCKRQLKLCKINAVKKKNKFKVKPILYDNAHVIVINPHNNYQIATVSKVVNIK
tara:strand:+ start:219 stop:608 length:390 start_codon:yes stop_codon:yes gene_type:complete